MNGTDEHVLFEERESTVEIYWDMGRFEDFKNDGDNIRQVNKQCLSRVIGYTVFIAFLYFLTVIRNLPTNLF